MRLSLVMFSDGRRRATPAAVDSALRHLTARFHDAELIVADPGASDADAAELESIARDTVTLRVLSEVPGGQVGASLRAGILAAAGDHVVVTDADLSYPLAEIDGMLAALDGDADLAVATRYERESRILTSARQLPALYRRHLGHRLFNAIAHAAIGLRAGDALAALKGFRRSAARTLVARQTLDGIAAHAELLFIAQRIGLSTREVPVLHRPVAPLQGESIGALSHALGDLWRIRRNERRGLYR
jgi:dolichyl-phosphate beta-glucosyltransferase